MSFSVTPQRSGTAGASDLDPSDSAFDPIEAPDGTPYDESTDWGKVGALAAGIVIGAVIGAGAALLLAPQSGSETRESIRGFGRRGKKRAGDAWEHLGDELWWFARKKKKQVRRGATRTGWMFEDLLDNIVGPVRGHGRPPRDDDEEDESGEVDQPKRGRVLVEEE